MARGREKGREDMAKTEAITTGSENALVAQVKSWPLQIRDFYHDVRTETKKVTTPSWKEVRATTAVVIITAYGSAANAVEAMKLGAVDFLEKPFDPKIIRILAEEILFRQRLGSSGSFDDLMHLADLARERNAHIEARAYLKAAMSRAFDRPEPYYWLGCLCEGEGEQKRAIQYYYMAVSANRTYEPAVEALKRLGKIQ